MDKHTKKTPSLFQYPVLVAFGLFFIGLFVLDMATPDPDPAAQADRRFRRRAEQLLHQLHPIRQGSGIWPRPVDQPAERGGDHPLPKDPERRHPAGPGAHDVRPALQHPEK